MSKENRFSVEQEREIYRRYRSGEKQYALASEYNVHPSSISRLIQKCQNSGKFESNRPSDTASSFPTYSVHGQDSSPPHAFPNGMQPIMPWATVSLAQDGRAISGGPFNSPSNTASLVSCHVEHGQKKTQGPIPPNMYLRGMQLEMHNAPVPLAHAGRAAIPAGPWAGQTVGGANFAAYPSQSNFIFPASSSRVQSSMLSHAATASFPAGSSRCEQPWWFPKGCAAPASFGASNQLSPPLSELSSDNIVNTHPVAKSGKDIGAQAFTPGRRSMISTNVEIPPVATPPALQVPHTASQDFTGSSEIEDTLKQRVEQRAELMKDSRGSEEILKCLVTNMVFNIEACECLEVKGLMDLGFSRRESELLSLDDDVWTKRNGWVETFVNSLPNFIRGDKRFTQPIKTAIVLEDISDSEDFVKRINTLSLPPVIKTYFRQIYRKLDEVNSLERCLEHPVLNAGVAEGGPDLCCEPVSGQQASRNDDAGDHCMSATSPSGPSSSDADAVLAEVVLAEAVLSGKCKTGQGHAGSPTASHALPESLTMSELFDIAMGCFSDLYPIEGVSGTMRPSAQNSILSAACKAVSVKCNILDLGCSSGHAVACAALSGLFSGVHGVDLPVNKLVIEDHYRMFITKAEKHPRLSIVQKGQLKEVHLHWANAGDVSKQNITDLLGLDPSHPFASHPLVVYWFKVGWKVSDAENAARILSKSPQVHCIVAVMPGFSSHGEGFLRMLNDNNSAGGTFKLSRKLSNLAMRGAGQFAAYIIVRELLEIENNDHKPASPNVGDRVEVLFDDQKWYCGSVTLYSDGIGQITFDDNSQEKFVTTDSEVFLLPRQEYQFRRCDRTEHGSRTPWKCRFCEVCFDQVGAGEGYLCACCTSTAVCFRCAHPHDAHGYICFTCRAELADVGRSQKPLVQSHESLQTQRPVDLVCYGCKERVSQVLSSKVSIKDKHHVCRFCNKVFGFCCTALMKGSKAPYSCPACVGPGCHDASLILAGKAMSKKMMNYTIQNSRRVEYMNDEWGYSISALQINCESDLLLEILPNVVKMLEGQVGEGKDPSIGPFNFLNIMALMDRSQTELFDLYQNVFKMYFSHAKKSAESVDNSAKRKHSGSADVKKGQAVLSGRRKLGFATADMRATPWWSLMKVFLIALTRIYDLYIISRPPCDLEGDPYFEMLCRGCTIVDFSQSTPDREVSNWSKETKLDIVFDAGGPTSNCFTGALALGMAPVQVAYLGYPANQPGGHVQWTITDQFVVDPDEIQGRQAHEQLAYLPKSYQPNASFVFEDVRLPEDPVVPSTARSDWGLGEGRFIFAIFCRLGRISREQTDCLAKILKRSPNSDLWIRAHPKFACLRILRRFRKHGIPRCRIVLAMDVPPDVHQERIRHVDLGLDTILYGAHTTAIDLFRKGVAMLCLRGVWWHMRVAFGLASALLGNDDLVATGLQEFEEKAVFYASAEGTEKLQNTIRPAIQDALKTHSSIFDGPAFVAAFQRLVNEMCRQVQAKEKPKDIFAEPRIRAAPSDGRPAVFVLLGSDQGQEFDSEGDIDALGLAENSNLSESEEHDDAPMSSRTPRTLGPGRDHRVEWLFDAAKKDPDSARLQALEYIRIQQPDLAARIFYIKNEQGNDLPFIQLPCLERHINPDTGRTLHYYELPFLFVVSGNHGRHLYSGQDFAKGQSLTRYDGTPVYSDKVTDRTFVRSLEYGRIAIDGRGKGDYSQTINCSLGHIANHETNKFVAATRIRLCKAPVSEQSKSIFLTAKIDGNAWSEVTTNYTSGAAERDHAIQMRPIEPGADKIGDKGFQSTPPLLKAAAQVLRKDGGFDLECVLGSGSFGVVIKVKNGDGFFAVKLGKTNYSKDARLGVLVEAAIMDVARRSQSKGVFALECRSLNGYPAALINADSEGQRVAAVAMELADSSARQIVDWMGTQFRSGVPGPLQSDPGPLHDVISFLKGTLTVLQFMQQAGLVHADLKPDNILLKKLNSTPTDSRLARCRVQGQFYQMLFGDWGHARWPGSGGAAHVFAEGGDPHRSLNILEIGESTSSIAGVGLRDLKVAFGLMLKKPQVFSHPGDGTEWILAPDKDYSRKFQKVEDGVEQRLHDQGGDIWSVGMIFARIMTAPPLNNSNRHPSVVLKHWRDDVIRSSRNAHEFSESAAEAAAKRTKFVDKANLGISRRAVGATAAAVAAAPHGPSYRPTALWLGAMVSEFYANDPWLALKTRIEGAHGASWVLVLEVVQKLLSFTNKDRVKFAAEALEHPCFLESE